MTFVLNDNSLSSDQGNHIILSVTPINGFNNVPVGTLPQLIGFIRFGEPVPHGLSARHRVWAGPTKG